jgi:DNA-binding transcriptional ArsR family regulator
MDSTANLRLEFLRHGVRSAKELAAGLGVSQPTISRYLAELEKSGPGQLVRIGEGRAARYGLANPIVDLGFEWPLYLITEDGSPDQLGRLQYLAGGAWHLEKSEHRINAALCAEDFRAGIFPGLPWFLDDLRPQGFLGRSFARIYGKELGQGSDPTTWSPAAVALVRYGHDLPGAFVLGTRSLGAALTAEGVRRLASEERAALYPRLAEEAIAGQLLGSSAGGEQPKFGAILLENGESKNVLVKFSGVMEQPEHRRWADLLAAEHIAAETLRDHGIPASLGTIHDFGGRRFLEVVRFDRHGANGRVPVVSLRALDAAYYGALHTPWAAAADRLEKDGWLEASDADSLRLLGTFGQLIANTDMHYGNVSLILQGRRPVKLAPSYDMLPMAYRPAIDGTLPMHHELPRLGSTPAAARAVELAAEFWRRVAESGNISVQFQEIAARHAQELRD